MNVLNNVIEKYNGVHRCSIVENDAQNIYDLTIGIICDKTYNASGTDVSMPVKRVKFSKQILKQESTTSLV